MPNSRTERLRKSTGPTTPSSPSSTSMAVRALPNSASVNSILASAAPGGVDLGVVTEQPAVVARHPPALVALFYGAPKFANVHPQGTGRVVEVLLSSAAILR